MQFVETHRARIPVAGLGTMRLKEEEGELAIRSRHRSGMLEKLKSPRGR